MLAVTFSGGDKMLRSIVCAPAAPVPSPCAPSCAQRVFPRGPATEGPLLEGRAEAWIIWENGFNLQVKFMYSERTVTLMTELL